MKNTCTLSDEELIAKCKVLVENLPQNQEGPWSFSTPPDFNNDPDIILPELIKRFEKVI